MLAEQAYRVALWRVAGEEINYRRFFDINELAAIRMEDPDVFADTHRFRPSSCRCRAGHRLRVDHPDGLYAPAEYFQRARGARVAHGVDGPFFIVAEKILSPGESLPQRWPIAGTTGYEVPQPP